MVDYSLMTKSCSEIIHLYRCVSKDLFAKLFEPSFDSNQFTSHHVMSKCSKPVILGVIFAVGLRRNDSGSMIGENWELVTDEQVEVQDCRKITDLMTNDPMTNDFRGIL